MIIGGGAAGATAALALRQAGVRTVVCEARPSGGADLGAFLAIMPGGLTALAALGAETRVRDASFPATDIEVRDADRPAELHRSDGTRVRPRTLTRAALYRELQAEVLDRGAELQHGRRLVGVEHRGDGVEARFADGSAQHADLLVGADGLRSAVRRMLDPAAPEPAYAGINVVYGSAREVPDPFPDGYRMIYGSRCYVGYTTAPDGTTWWFARIPRPELTRDELDGNGPQDWKRLVLDHLGDDRTPAAGVVRASGNDVLAVNARQLPSTPVWHDDRTVLVGDAVHACSPAAGIGATLAFEDAVVLGKCLRDVPGTTAALHTYERVRRDRVEQLVAAGAGQAHTSAHRFAGTSSAGADAGGGHHADWASPVHAGRATPEPHRADPGGSTPRGHPGQWGH
nr:FAD-dependent monooxygenase [Saccharopolyspora sp. HNM0983]